MRRLKLNNLAAPLAALVLSANGIGCQSPPAGSDAQTSTPAAASSRSNVATNNAARNPAMYTYEVVNTWPHDPNAYTQGLVFKDGYLLESTGRNGESTLRKVELTTGNVLQSVKIASQYFAEGLTLFNGKLFQLTWTTRTGFIYDAETFERTGEFYFDGEGWGLTHDGQSLIMSDGTNQIRFLDPDTFKIRRTISVLDGNRPLRDLNELEYVKGEIYANVWHTDRIARIDPQTGAVLGWIDLTGLLPLAERGGDEDAVLNGIAYDEAGDRLFVTGKLWPKLFEIRVKEKR